MNSGRWSRLQDLFERTLDLETGERNAFLDEACVDDEALRSELLAMLEQHLDQRGILDSPTGSWTVHSATDRPTLIGRSVGGYRVERFLATGGMGSVYVAVQENPRRQVALKVISTALATRSVLRRFELESLVLAKLQHPNIAQVYEAGTHDDATGPIPFFAMEYVVGSRTITDFASDEDLPVRERLALFATVCDAVHHGHLKGVIHRDIKPANILIDTSSGSAVPKIIDFGVARLVDSENSGVTAQTQIGHLIGTLLYMSPEQCGPDAADLDVRSDVYSLGVVLFELLCERPPYDLQRVPVAQAPQIIREQPPARPRTINRELRGDIETIVLKALAKDRSRRYQSAHELAQDIRSYLKHEPVTAHPDSALYNFRMFARRNRTIVGATAAIIVVLVTAVVVSLMFALELERASRFPIALQRKMENDRGDWIYPLMGTELCAQDANRAGAPFLIVGNLRAGGMGFGQGVVDFFDASGGTVRRHLCVLEIPKSVDGTHARKTTAPLVDAILADIVPHEGKELLLALNDPHFSSSVLRLRDLGLNMIFEVWNVGHCVSVLFHEQKHRIVGVAVSNRLTYYVPELVGYSLIGKQSPTNPRVLFGFDPQKLPLATTRGLFPLSVDDTVESISGLWMLARIPNVALEKGQWIVRLGDCEPSERDDALCKLTVTYQRPGNPNEDRFFVLVGPEGHLIGPAMDEQGRSVTTVTGLPAPEFLKLDLPALHHAARMADDLMPEIEDIPLKRISKELATYASLPLQVHRIVKSRYENPAWLIERAWSIVEQPPQGDRSRLSPSSTFNKYAYALRLARKADQLCPDTAAVLRVLGAAYFRNQKYKLAQKTLLRSNEQARQPWTLGYLAMTYAMLDIREEARVTLERMRTEIQTDVDRHKVDERTGRLLSEAEELIATRFDTSMPSSRATRQPITLLEDGSFLEIHEPLNQNTNHASPVKPQAFPMRFQHLILWTNNGLVGLLGTSAQTYANSYNATNSASRPGDRGRSTVVPRRARPRLTFCARQADAASQRQVDSKPGCCNQEDYGSLCVAQEPEESRA